MENAITRWLLVFTLLVAGCGGGGGGGGSPNSSGLGGGDGGSTQSFNGGLTGKIYHDLQGAYRELDLATGQLRLVYDYYIGDYAMPDREGQEFAVGANTSENGSYNDEDVIFFDPTGKETDRRVISGEVRGVVRISPDHRYFAFYWYKNSENNGLMVLERNGDWERNFGDINGRGFDWTSDGKLVFSNDNVIYRVDDVRASEPEKIAELPTDTWQYALGLNISPDDKKIAFWFKGQGEYTGHIFVIGMDGSNLHQVTDSNLWEHSVAWSPDGRFLAVVKGAFLTNVPDSYWSDDNGRGNLTPMLYVVKADSSNVDVSADEPKDAIVIRENQPDLGMTYAMPDSPIAWRAANRK